MIGIGSEKQCGFFLGAEQICNLYMGSDQVFGCGDPPVVGGMTRDYAGGVYQFVLEDFTNLFQDVNGDSYLKTKITSLPSVGTVKYSGAPVAVDFEFTLADIANLTYELPAGYQVTNGGYYDDQGTYFSKQVLKVGFRTSDDSDQELYSNLSTFALRFQTGNRPPSVSNNSANLTDLTYTFQESDFIKDFSDPDGDSYLNVRIKGLTDIGELQYNGVAADTDTKFDTADAVNLAFVLSDAYAVYNGDLYQFDENLDDIIATNDADGFYLTENEDGKLTFTDAEGNKRYESGDLYEGIIRLAFSTSDDNNLLELESDVAIFTLIPSGDVNVKALHVNEPPVVGDNEFDI